VPPAADVVYTRPVDYKKLDFILEALRRYAADVGRDVASLSVLELGAGRGGVVLPILRLGCRVRAVDMDEASLAELLERAGGNPNLEASVDDALTFAEGTYDVVIASEVIGHVREPEKLVETAAARLQPGGLFVLTAPNSHGPWELKNRVSPIARLRRSNWLRKRLGKQPFVRGSGLDQIHSFSRTDLLALLRTHGFELIESRNSDSVLTALGGLYDRSRLLGRLDVRLADRVPYWLASGWYLDLRLRREPASPR
jgi:SAM-dependent methyltransferase